VDAKLTDAYNFDDVVTEDITLYARWEIATSFARPNAALRLYLNPVANGKLTVDNIFPDDGNIEVYNALGALAVSHPITGNTTIVDLSALPAGIYIVKVNGQIAKIVKK
jgi:hypothetical protein